MSKSEQNYGYDTATIGKMKIAPRQTLAVPCPVCIAKVGQKCELETGEQRNTFHRYREWVAKDKAAVPKSAARK